MRGKAERCGFAADRTGITPAYAGKSWYASYEWFPSKDHPRLCGEKQGGD